MPTQDTSEIKEKILSLLRVRGPSLPVHIAKETGLSMLFASAFLSELLSEKKIKISNMKIGSSPVYFILGQEPMLERFSQYLKSKEKDAFILLKEKTFLKDKEQEPAIRVALRTIKDFAIPFKKNEEIFWKYFIVPEPHIKILETQSKKSNQLNSNKISVNNPNIRQKPQELDIFDKDTKEKSLKKIIVNRQKKKEKSEFVIYVLNFLKENNIEILEEMEFKKREFSGIAKINSNLGSIEILVIAKNKKKITENDLQVSIQKGQANKRIILFISSGELDKKATEFIKEYRNILRFLKIKGNF